MFTALAEFFSSELLSFLKRTRLHLDLYMRVDFKAVADIHLRCGSSDAVQTYKARQCFSLALSGGRNTTVNIAQRRKTSAHTAWSRVCPQGQ